MERKKPWSDERVKAAFASLAENEMADLDRKLRAIFRGVDREWPDAMCNNEVAPSVAFLLFSAVEGLLESNREARELAKRALKFKNERGRLPSLNSPDPWEQRMAEGIAYLQRKTSEARDG